MIHKQKACWNILLSNRIHIEALIDRIYEALMKITLLER